MNGINNIQAEGQLYDILAPEVVNDYVEKLGKPCANPNGYTTGSLILATDGGNVQRLYKVTQAINSSQNIVEDGNVVRKKLGDLFDDLEVALSGEIADVDTELGNVKQALSNEVTTRATLGVHNLITFPYATADEVIGGELSVHVEDDGSLTVSTIGTTTAARQYFLSYHYYFPQGTYILSGAPDEGQGQDYCLYFSHNQNYYDTGKGATAYVNTSGFSSIVLSVAAGQNFSNKKFYPMIRLASDTDPTYQPYAMTNKELTEAVKCLVLSTGSTTVNALPYTFTNANIENDMVCINSVLSNPSAQTGDWTVTTSSGTAQITGAISGATTITLYLMKSR